MRPSRGRFRKRRTATLRTSLARSNSAVVSRCLCYRAAAAQAALPRADRWSSPPAPSAARSSEEETVSNATIGGNRKGSVHWCQDKSDHSRARRAATIGRSRARVIPSSNLACAGCALPSRGLQMRDPMSPRRRETHIATRARSFFHSRAF
jgi:hypothetical protein